jgi:hypothetical protein
MIDFHLHYYWHNIPLYLLSSSGIFYSIRYRSLSSWKRQQIGVLCAWIELSALVHITDSNWWEKSNIHCVVDKNSNFWWAFCSMYKQRSVKCNLKLCSSRQLLYHQDSLLFLVRVSVPYLISVCPSFAWLVYASSSFFSIK